MADLTENLKSWLWKGFAIQTIGAVVSFLLLIIPTIILLGGSLFLILAAIATGNIALLVSVIPLLIIWFIVACFVNGWIIVSIDHGKIAKIEILPFMWKGLIYTIAIAIIGFILGFLSIQTNLLGATLLFVTNPLMAIISIPVALLISGLLVDKIGGD